MEHCSRYARLRCTLLPLPKVGLPSIVVLAAVLPFDVILSPALFREDNGNDCPDVCGLLSTEQQFADNGAHVARAISRTFDRKIMEPPPLANKR